ncbi:tetratricopeptide repeat protein [Streptomyces sp. NPDC005017]|uniref:tetratricopeptide repeat protein n=1 Tax=Streptomyces sp. NPDC005017 TaxID=3364706 RepID=UPI0036D02D96
MLDTPEAVVEALRENHDRPHGLARTVTAEELVEAAEPFDKPDVVVTALLELMTAYEFTGEHRKSPVVFARLLRLWETVPESFSEWEAHQVFWRFKWVTTSLLQVPDVPLATVRGWIDRMRGFYEAAEHGMQPVAAMRYHVAAHTGLGPQDAYDLWVTRPRTELSDCEACEIRYLAGHQVTVGDDAAALEVWHPVLSGASGCSEEPQMSQARALLPLLRLGRADEARSHHLTGYRRVRGNPGMQAEVGLHLEFCALSRNEGRGLEILAENRPLFEATGAPLDRLGFLTGVEVLLARLAEDGHTGTPVAGPPGRSWTALELLAHVRSEAEKLVSAFDARNGTPAVGERRHARLAQRPLLDEPLPLGLRTAVTRTPAAAPPAAAVRGTAVELPDDFVSLVREARRMTTEGHPGSIRVWTRVTERLADGSGAHEGSLGPADLLEAELAEHRARLHAHDDGRRTDSVAELRRAAELFTGLGMPWHALSARARALAWSTIPDTGDAAPESARSELDEVLREAQRLLAEVPLSGEPVGEEGTAFGSEVGSERELEYLALLFSCAYAAHQDVLRELPEASDLVLERFEDATRRLRSEAERLGMPHQVANARQFVGELAARRGELDRAEEEMRAALKDVAEAGRPWRATRPLAMLGQILLSKDEPAEAAEVLHQAIVEAVRHDDTEFPMAATYSLVGHAAAHSGDFAGAVRHLTEAATRYDQESAFDDATEARLQLADVLARGGQQADAVAVLESVLSDEAAGSLDERLRAQARLTLARGLRELSEYLASAEEFLRLADAVAGWEDDPAIQTLVAAEAAIALAMADRWDAAATAYERAVAAHAVAANPSLITHMMCEFARLAMLARGTDGVDEALGHLARADAVVAAVPEDTETFTTWYESGTVHYRRARVLAEAERFPEALTQAEAAVAAHEQGGEHGEVPRAEAVRVAALIEGNGLERYDDAVVRLTAAARRCRHAGLTEAAEILDALREDYLTRQGA